MMKLSDDECEKKDNDKNGNKGNVIREVANNKKNRIVDILWANRR